MSNEMKDWIDERKDDALIAIGKIARIYEDYHCTESAVLKKVGEILKEYDFID